jgi:hypothetical protein
MLNSTPIAGWYPDPQGHFDLRYWDGAAWTSHTSGASASQPASPTDPWSQSTIPTSAYPGGDPFATSGTARSGAGVRWWVWLVVAVAIAGVGTLVVYGVSAATSAIRANNDEQSESNDNWPMPSSEPDDDDFDYYSAEGTETWTTPQGLATFEVHRSWREDLEAVLDFSPEMESDLAGSWNLDGESFDDTWHYMYVWEFADLADDGLTLEEAGEEYYSSLLYLDDVYVITRNLDTFTNSHGHEVWTEHLTYLDADGSTSETYVAVTTDGADWLIFDITDGLGGQEDSRIADMIDSVAFVSD